MLNAAHVLETALLILAAFLIGATVGTLARLALRRPQRTPVAAVIPAVVAAPSEPTVAEAPALVTAPTIEPLPRPAAPVVPTDIPAPDFAAVIQPVAPPTVTPRPAPVAPIATGAAMAPARVAGQTTSGKLVPAPIHDEPRRVVAPGASSAEVIPFPASRTAAAVAEKPEPVASVEAQPVAPVAVSDAEPEVAAAPSLESALASEPVALPEPAEPPEVALVPQSIADPTEQVNAAPAEPASSTEQDEAAAMRAIEGNWSPRRRQPARPVAAPVSEAVPAPTPPVELPGKPVGLEAPRAGGKDDLTHVIGVLPIIETALNSIGVYHFDQLAEFTDENVGWLENHLGIEGRIGREHWREQARELALVSGKASKAAGQL